MPPKKPDPEQGQLFVQSPGTKNEYPVGGSEDSDSGASVPIELRNVRLQEALRTLGAISSLTALTTLSGVARRELSVAYGSQGANQLVLNSRRRIPGLEDRAKAFFAAAFGRPQLMASGENEADVKTHMSGEYLNFIRKYGGPDHKEARQNAILQLIHAEVAYHTGTSKKKEPASKGTVEAQTPMKKFDFHGRLLALDADSNAHFLPASRPEVNRAVALLDYEKNPEYPLGPSQQLGEIFTRRARGFSRQDQMQAIQEDTNLRKDRSYGTGEAKQAVTSVVHEMGDYLQNAVESIEVLRSLKLELDGVSPRQLIADVTGYDNPALAVLLRYFDQMYYREHGQNPTGVDLDVFRSREERLPERLPNGKGKIIHDAYTSPHPSKRMQKRYAKAYTQIGVGDVRHSIDEIIDDQLRRASFWERQIFEATHITFIRSIGKQILHSVA